MIKQKFYLLLENLDQLSYLNIVLFPVLFQVVLLSKPDFNFCNSLALSWVDKVTTGTKSFESLILNVGTWFYETIYKTFIIKKFAYQVRTRLISQLITGISRVFQKLLE